MRKFYFKCQLFLGIITPPSAGIVAMSMLDKAKEFADRIADINQQVQTGDVNFEQASRYALDCNDCGG
jgi:hypothetical protein|tara:strand:- start:13 stop:216 length:204 start_codon:yes stop_codon:yes gene_type:complete